MDLNKIFGELGKESKLESNSAADPRIFIWQEVLGIGRDLKPLGASSFTPVYRLIRKKKKCNSM